MTAAARPLQRYHLKSVADEAAIDVEHTSFAAASIEDACQVARAWCARRGGRAYVKREGSDRNWDWRCYRGADGQVREGREGQG